MSITRVPPSFARPFASELPDGAVIVSRRTLASGIAAAIAVVLWAAAATLYVAFRDEIAQRVFAHQTEMRYGYEDRIADLKGRLEREITQNLVERNGFKARAESLAARQVEIESRQAWLQGLADRLSVATLAGSAGPGAGPPQPLLARNPSPEPQETGSVAPIKEPKPAPLDEAQGFRLRAAPPHAAEGDRPREKLSAVERSLQRTSGLAIDAADSLRRGAYSRSAKVRLALETTRLDTKRLTTRDAAAGGPLVAVSRAFDAAAFGPVMAEAEASASELARLVAAARGLPLGAPLIGELEPTSTFGYRLDPFTRGPAFHTGADFRAETGAPVRATAQGRVIVAEWAAGYGNLVEIEHAAGVTTRYGHLSSIGVAAGQVVNVGQAIGRVGSTGRSTGAHLHYEVRVDGAPVNPTRFLEAGRLLADS